MEIKPCKKCGADEAIVKDVYFDCFHYETKVRCPQCGNESKPCNGYDEAIEEWNREQGNEE